MRATCRKDLAHGRLALPLQPIMALLSAPLHPKLHYIHCWARPRIPSSTTHSTSDPPPPPQPRYLPTYPRPQFVSSPANWPSQLAKMASLRTQTAARLLRVSTSMTGRSSALATAQQRWKSDDASTALSQNNLPTPPEARPANTPDYGVHIDKATSYVIARALEHVWTVIDEHV